ncbi:MAG: NAD(P)-dependent glycerol-1-phosphate dehydrogenase [Thermoplasmatota archaeon]|nr:NAD(P)-dependent glycerol-1-phosphate dehydrogenase [Candidatus Thermoplasmatota archaeon]MBU1915036.1 NAD(P)-dependent glycerol-1-phosphate dehydrogenase [Candidatus Thermoplasmatota archaeon]
MLDGFTKTRAMNFPRQVLAGHGCISQIGDMCEGFELRGTALIVTGPTTGALAAHQVKDALLQKKYDVQQVEVGVATQQNLVKVEEIAKDVKASFLLGVGGGSKIDLAKLASANLKMPFISVPTSASHDGLASPRASIKDGGNSLSLIASVPLGVIADTALIVKAPYRLLASGCADVISNTTAVLDWELAVRLRTEDFSSSAANLAKYAAESIIENAAGIKPNLEESVWVAIRPIIISGISMAVAGSSRPTSGSEHMFSHLLDKIAPGKALHGEQCGVGSIMMMYLHGGNWQRMRDALQMIGAPTSSKELGVSEEQLIEALVHAHEIRKDRYTVLGDRGLTPDAAERLARITKVV